MWGDRDDGVGFRSREVREDRVVKGGRRERERERVRERATNRERERDSEEWEGTRERSGRGASARLRDRDLSSSDGRDEWAVHESRESEGYRPKGGEMNRAKEGHRDGLGLDAPSLSQGEHAKWDKHRPLVPPLWCVRARKVCVCTRVCVCVCVCLHVYSMV